MEASAKGTLPCTALIWRRCPASSFFDGDLLTREDALINATYRRTGSTGLAAGAAEIQLNLISRDLLHMPKN